MPGLSAEEIVDVFRSQMFTKGTSIRNLGRIFNQADDNGTQKLDEDEFAEVTAFAGLFCTKPELKKLFKAIDYDGSNSVALSELIHALRKELNARRQSIVNQAFDKMNRNGDGQLTVGDLKGVYDVSNHPEVIKGEKTENEALADFLNGFDGEIGGNDNGVVTEAEWNSYYTDLSATIPSDDYFCMMVGNTWNIQETDDADERALAGLEAIVREKIRQKCTEGANPAQRLEKTFKQFDTEESKRVSKKEFQQAMEIFGIICNDRQTNLFFNKYDLDNNGFDVVRFRIAMFGI